MTEFDAVGRHLSFLTAPGSPTAVARGHMSAGHAAMFDQDYLAAIKWYERAARAVEQPSGQTQRAYRQQALKCVHKAREKAREAGLR